MVKYFNLKGIAMLKYSARVSIVFCTTLLILFSQTATAAPNANNDPINLTPIFNDKDAERPQIPVTLVPVATGVSQPTDIQFFPGSSDKMVILEKPGGIRIFKLSKSKVVQAFKTMLEVHVNTASEQGMLGLAFHPAFAANKTIFISYNPINPNKYSRVAKWTVDKNDIAQSETIILNFPQPFGNHKGGQIAFGADKYLYLGFGDGGSGGDPQGNGQNRQTFLGKILRLDINHATNSSEYSIPQDNPFVNDPNTLPEIFALGLRNPWRFSFDNLGRLIVADVGQNKWEEIDIVNKGANLGWNIKEGTHCYPPDSTCDSKGLTDPIYEYGREDGASVIGGYVYNGKNTKLKNKYIFGDFVSGRIWALDLPNPYVPNQSTAKIYALGRFKIAMSTFGRDAAGNVYVADFNSGTIYRIE
jgi:glucose/arabinose dehydrogenase